MSDSRTAWYDDQEEIANGKELLAWKEKLDTAERRSEILHLLKHSRERLNRLQGFDLRLTRYEHKILEDAIAALNKVLT